MAEEDVNMADFGEDDADFEDDNDGFDDGFDDEDDGFGDDGDWGDLVEDDGFTIKHDAKALAVAKKEKKEAEENKELQNTEWKCLECKHVNKGMGLLCLGCNKPNLGELDRQKRKREMKEAGFWADIFSEIYLSLQLHIKSGFDLDISVAEDSLRSIFVHELVQRRIPDLKKYDKAHLKKKCDSCTCEFDEKEVTREELCCHGNICKECIGNWIKSKISDENIIPFIRCPAEDCDYAIPIYVYFDAKVKLTAADLYRFISVYCEKQLARNSNWINCSNAKGKCKYGFLFALNENEKQVKCENCGSKQTIKRKTEFDEGFKAMLKSGKIRTCPKCKFAHMKDKGLCNVLQCGKCKIWWNWRTREMANTQKQLKQRARANRSLWEPGELEYQMKLQRDDPAAFQHLLESNGIKYDANYMRGQ